MVRDVPVCMFGATPYSILGGIGTPWMVGSTGLNPFAVQKELLRLSRPALARMQQAFPSMLFNVVDQRNEAAQRIGWASTSSRRCRSDRTAPFPSVLLSA